MTKAGNRLVAPRRPPQSRRTREACRRGRRHHARGPVDRAARYFEQEKPRCGCRHGDGADRLMRGAVTKRTFPAAVRPFRIGARPLQRGKDGPRLPWPVPASSRSRLASVTTNGVRNSWQAYRHMSGSRNISVTNTAGWWVPREGISRRQQSSTLMVTCDPYARTLSFFPSP